MTTVVLLLKRSCGSSRACWDVETERLLRKQSHEEHGSGVSNHGAPMSFTCLPRVAMGTRRSPETCVIQFPWGPGGGRGGSLDGPDPLQEAKKKRGAGLGTAATI